MSRRRLTQKQTDELMGILNDIERHNCQHGTPGARARNLLSGFLTQHGHQTGDGKKSS